MLAYSQGKESERRDEAPAAYAEAAKRDAIKACGSGESATVFECVYEIVKASQDQAQAEQDLEAQQGMKLWAAIMAVLTAFTVAITAVGVWFVKRTLDATLAAVEDTGRATEQMRKANEIAANTLRETKRSQRRTQLNAEAQIRAWIEVTGVLVQCVSDSELEFDEFSIDLKNGGQSPAFLYEYEALIVLMKRKSEGHHKIELANITTEVQIAVGNNSGTIRLPPIRVNEDIFTHTSGSSDWLVQIEGEISYTDVFGRRRKTQFSYATGADFWNKYPDNPYHCHPQSERNQIL